MGCKAPALRVLITEEAGVSGQCVPGLEPGNKENKRLCHFGQSAVASWGPLSLSLPVLTSFDWRAAALALLAAVLIFRFKWSVLKTLPVAALGGLALSTLTGF